MAENPKLDFPRISVSSNLANAAAGQLMMMNPDSGSFAVDVERLSHLSAATDNDGTGNSRITLQRSLSRKGYLHRGASDKKIASNNNDREANIPGLASPRASILAGTNTPEKSMVVMVGTTDQDLNPQLHHPITILTGNVGGGGGGGAAESRSPAKRYSFRRSSAPWSFHPRRILILFATMSSIGSILLIYFTLSMTKLNGEDSSLVT